MNELETNKQPAIFVPFLFHQSAFFVSGNPTGYWIVEFFTIQPDTKSGAPLKISMSKSFLTL